MTDSLKVLVVDDSSLYRKIISNAVKGMPVATDIQTAPSGAIALRKIPEFNPDIVLLDIEMPDMSGIEVLKKIRESYPQITVVLVSGANSRSADITIEGLSSGASIFIPKPSGTNIEANVAELQRGISEAFALIEARKLKRETRRTERQLAPAPKPPPVAAPPRGGIPSIVPARVDVVTIGISTGGPNALETMLPMIPESFPVPIVIVQHMPPLFTASLAKSLNSHSKLRVVEAEDRQALQPGCVYIAPGGKHMLIRRIESGENSQLIIKLDDGPPVNSCKPAVDLMFASVAKATGKNTLAVVMTGMGADGAVGVADIKGMAGYCLTQSEETCTVYGMPHAVDEAGLSDESIPLEMIAQRIVEIAGGAIGRLAAT